MTHGDDDRSCSRCDHMKAEHADNGCLHRDRLPDLEHGNPEWKLCDCEGFQVRPGKFEQVR
jgi:hypothetical protein